MRTNCGPFQQFGPHADQVRNCGPLRSHCIGRWGAWTWDGGGTTSEVLGSWKVRFNFAWPPGSDSRQKLACRPLFQKFATWENWWKATVWRWGEKWFGGAGGSCWALAGWAMNMEGRRYDFRGWGKLECEAHRGGPLAVSLLDGLVSKKKFVIWENWWWAKAWAVGDQGAWGIMVADQPAVAGFHHIFCRPAHCTTPVTPLIVYQCAQFCKQAHFFKNTSTSSTKIRAKYGESMSKIGQIYEQN